jgi:hypothetical protein
VKEIARNYGWHRAVHVSDYCAKYPSVDPFAGNDKQIVSAVANPPAPPPAGPSRGDANGVSVMFECVCIYVFLHTYVITPTRSAVT